MYENNHKYFGLAVSPGIASGKVYLHRSDSTLHIPRMQIQRKDIPCEMDKLIAARIKVEHELYTLRETISTKFGASYAELIDSQIAILNDEEITKQIQAYMDEHLVHVPFAFRVILNQYIDIMDGGQSDFFKERIMDVRDIKQQVLKNLLGLDHDMSLSSQTDSIILVSKYLSPGDIIRLSSDNVVGMVSETGGKTSHAAILAKAMGIPTLLGVEDITYNLNSGDRILLDALHGHLIYQPDQETEQHYRKKMARYTAKNADYKELRSEEAQTCDGRKIELLANIELPVESKQVLEYKAKGVGLYRSEYLYLMKKILPTEEELFDEYYRVVSALPDKEIIIRTIDLGGDKIAAALAKHTRDESNTFMGYRAIRISLDQPDLFITQLKAILRASAFGKISIMLPMITVMEELISAKEFIEKAKNELRKEGKKFNENIPVGMLVEVPSAAMMAEEFAAQVDFLSIGTNDLTQYLLAVDRGNEKVNKLYNHFDPVVLRTLRWIVNAANSNKVPLSVCGEMAGDPKAIIVLLGLGINRLSMSPVSLDRVRFAVRNLDYTKARVFVNKLLKMTSRTDIMKKIDRKFDKLFPEWDNSEVDNSL